MKINFIKNNRRPGYLLVESMINLIVCVLAIWTIITMTNFMVRTFSSQTTDFYAAINLLESDHFDFKVLRLRNDDVLLYSLATKKRYHMQKYQDMLRFTGDNLGHVPTLTNVWKVHWQRSGRGLITSVVFKNGEKHQAYSRLAVK